MWIDDDGVLHTVAVPEPEQLMDPTFRSDLDALLRSGQAEIEELLEEAEEAVYVGDLPDPDELGLFEAQAPPRSILYGELTSAEDLSVAITRIEAQWRLDAILALQDYLER